jgi:hypothetical protein
MKDHNWMYATPSQLQLIRRLTDEASRLGVPVGRGYQTRPGHPLTKSQASLMIENIKTSIDLYLERLNAASESSPRGEMVDAIIGYYCEGLPIVNSMWRAKSDFPEVDDPINAIWRDCMCEAQRKLKASNLWDDHRASSVGKFEISRAFPDANEVELQDLYSRYGIIQRVAQ